jgi:phospholipid-binding lipoprotein MlaA
MRIGKVAFVVLICVYGLSGTVHGEDTRVLAQVGIGAVPGAVGEGLGEGQDTADEFDDEFEDEFDGQEIPVWDPIEPFNQGMFWFNDRLYFYLFKPIARGLRILPEGTRESVDNFFSNLTTPIRFANALLQLKFGAAGTEAGRFVINTILGIGGIFDYARRHFDLYKTNEDFGQTLGHYGVGPGPYLVLPFLGPSNPRDSLGLIPDAYIDPINWWLADNQFWTAVGIHAGVRVNKLSLDKDTYEAIKAEQLDPYLFVRDAYMQRRAKLVEK